MAKRVFELARELGVTSKVVLEKCRAEDLELKNHMSALSAGLEATIAEWFSEETTRTAIEQTAHVDLTKAREEAKKRRRRKTRKAKEEEAIALAEAAAIAEASAATVTEEGEPGEDIDTLEAPHEVVEVAEPAVEIEGEAARPAVEEPVPEVASEEAAEPEKEEDVKPAGPQVVPKPAKLKGPRVVRMGKPDFIPGRRRSREPTTTEPAQLAKQLWSQNKGPAAAQEVTPQRGKKKAKRRSPRRRAGRTADSGEKLKEWRDRDLQERSARLAAAGVGLRRHRASLSRRPTQFRPTIKTGKIEIEEPITIKSLSAATGIRGVEIIKKLLQNGVMATINQVIGRETAESIAVDYDIELAVKQSKTAEQQLIETLEEREKGEMITRAPVATFLGHVDHGKTSLLDYIRNTTVADKEAGGITQHIGAYRYDKDDTHVVFLDTPGHEAFTAMRARGANMTDVVVLVVAADDGVMPQTVEAISHARAADVPIVVALNKIDVPNANVQRALGQLAEHGLQPREWGGEVEVIHTSAVTGEGIENLVETLSLEAELLELKAETDAPASGYVVEAEMTLGVGVTATLLVLNGMLTVGNIVQAGRSYGRIRQISDDRGRSIEHAGPSTPVQVAGLDKVPEAGDRFFIVKSLEQARSVAVDRRAQARTRQLAVAPQKSLEELLNRIEAGEVSELPLIVKADVQGSIEAIVGSLNNLSTGEIRTNILHSAVGGISTGDVSLAEASNAIIIGFNVVAGAPARAQAEAMGVDIRTYRVIYNVIEDIRTAMEEGLAPEIHEETLGHAEVREVFKVSRIGTIAGCYVTDGLVNRNARVRIVRDDIIIRDGLGLESLKRFKDDVREVRAGLECGLKIAGYDDIKKGDAFEFYEQVEVARKL